jgi:hypothetical protein
VQIRDLRQADDPLAGPPGRIWPAELAIYLSVVTISASFYHF